MYADQVASSNKRSVKERLNGDSEDDFCRSRQLNNKRQRQNDSKWKHDLYEDDEEPQVSNPKVGTGDLRLKLQKKGQQQIYRSGKRSLAVGRQDLREKLSGTMHSQPANTDLPKAKPVKEVTGRQDLREKLSGTMHSQPANTDLPQAKPVKEVTNATGRSAPSEVVAPQTKMVVRSAPPRKKSQQKGDTVDGFLQSLGLEKYQITFKAEEIDMIALMHMTDDDLKALGVPMGPRKKILLALDSRD